MAALTARGGMQAWWLASRPRTWPAAVTPVAVGTALGAREGAFHAGWAAAAAATALLLQIGANLANDLFDFERGADTPERLGPLRATQAGLVSPAAMRRATAAAFTAAALVGLALVARGGVPLAVAGAGSLLAGYLYTGGPWPLGYRGLGDPLVFVFFGGVGVAGSAYVQTLDLSAAALVLSVPVGFLATAILAVNNLRDLEGDRRAGKHTLAVRLGARATRVYYALLLAGAHVAVAIGVASGTLPAGTLLALLIFPASVALVRRVARREGRALNPCLGATASHEAGFGALLVAGLCL